MVHRVEFAERAERGYQHPTVGVVAIASLVVTPRIDIGSKFSDVIIGQESSAYLKIEENVSTTESTVLLVEADGRTREKGDSMLKTVAERVGRLANSPDQALSMMNEQPFFSGMHYR